MNEWKLEVYEILNERKVNFCVILGLKFLCKVNCFKRFLNFKVFMK